MEKVLNLYKPRGKTPLEVIKAYQEKNPEYEGVPMGYAGRLDPMAEGVLLVLVGEENKKRKEYERQKKEYEFTVLFGFETDSYDTLGKILAYSKPDAQIISDKLPEAISSYKGKLIQEYPPFSSPRVKGRPLFKWAREGKLSEVEIPKKEIEIYDFQFAGLKTISHDQLIDMIIHTIQEVKGVFRQEEILKGWIEFFKTNTVLQFPVATFTISCSSGTYVRSISHEMGKKVGFGGIALVIKRTRVGEYTLESSEKVI